MLKNVSQLTEQVGEKTYMLICDSDSPIPDVREALRIFESQVNKIEDQVKAQIAQLESERLKTEDAKEEIVEAEVIE